MITLRHIPYAPLQEHFFRITLAATVHKGHKQSEQQKQTGNDRCRHYGLVKVVALPYPRRKRNRGQ